MYIKFWGTRGSIPTPLSTAAIEDKIKQALQRANGLNLSDPNVIDDYVSRLPFCITGTIGGDTTCVEVRSGEQRLIIDAGSGLRQLGFDMMAGEFGRGQGKADFLITHTHWDHIHGFPFFVPAFIPNNVFSFYSPFEDMAERLNRQQEQSFFPVPVSYMSSTRQFVTIPQTGWTQIGNFRVQPFKLSHPGETYGYRIEDGNSCLVFASDAEYKRVDRESTECYVSFFSQADLLVFDAQYTWTEALDRPDWGHSSAVMGAEMAHRAGVKRLALTHHDPTSSDEKIWAAREQAEGYLSHRQQPQECEVLIAYDGLSLEI